MIKTVIARSKTWAERHRFKDNEFCISISCPIDKEASLLINNDNVIRFKFSDIEPSNKKHFPHHLEDECSFHINDAIIIVSKVLELANDCKKWTLIVHCAAGVSRSGAIAKWALSHSDMNDADFASSNIGIHPNQWIYQLLCFVEEYKMYKK